MKTTFLLSLNLLFVCQASMAQYDNNNKRDSSKISNAKYYYADLDNDKKEIAAVTLAFSSIHFQDIRYDTSFVAINWNMFSFTKTLNKKYDFNGGLATNLSRYFNRYYRMYNDEASRELVCYIKKFSITLKYELLDHFNSGSQLLTETGNDLILEIECYYKTGGFLYPAARIDTSYTTTFPGGETSFTDAVKGMLSPLMAKMEHLNLETITTRTKYTPEQITARYAARFALPVLATDVPKKGIYKSLAEFKNNEPSIDSFSIAADKFKYNAANMSRIDITSLVTKAVQKRNTAVFLYDAAHELVSPSTIFGYSDGATFWIQHGAFYYPLVRVGNAFEFMYIYHYADTRQSSQTLYILMPLNLETGKSN